MKWVVRVVRMPQINDFRAGYFPRYFALKRDAVALQKEVKEKGGEATITREKK